MNYKYRCAECKATGWARGYFEPDTNAGGINDDELLDACEHTMGGGDYEIIDHEYEPRMEDDVL